MKIAHLKVLDGVRAMAALMVMFFHFFQNVKTEGKLYDFLRFTTAFGRTGVTLFFVLSGFLITRMLLSTKTKENFFKVFYMRRALRIFPLYYFFLLLFYFLIPAVTSEPYHPVREQIPYYIYLQNVAGLFHWPSYGPGHFWSLAVEENFYFVWPFVVYFLSEKWLFRVIVAFVILSFGVRLIPLSRGIGGQYFIMSSFDALAIGALLALKEARSGFDARSGKLFRNLFIGFLIPTLFFWMVIGEEGPRGIQVLQFPFVTIVYLTMMGYLLSNQHNRYINNVFCSSPLLYLGKISYGLYVYHNICFYFYLSICQQVIFL